MSHKSSIIYALAYECVSLLEYTDEVMLETKVENLKKLLSLSVLIFTNSIVFAEIKFIENKTVLGQLLIMDDFNRIGNGKGLLRMPIVNLESTIIPSFFNNPNRRCRISSQHHSD